jgi:RNA polymerase sigma-70 factor, ECF subfamily
MVELMTDEDLVDLVCKGETRRFEELVQRHQDAVYSMALRYARTGGDAEDIAQEAFLRAFRSLDSFRREAKFSTWLFRITYNLCVDWGRRNARRRATERMLDETEEIVDRRADVESVALAAIEGEQIRAEADRLAERYRVVIMMYYYDGQSYEEIGRILGIPPKTVETRLYRARRLLRKALGRRGGVSG